LALSLSDFGLLIVAAALGACARLEIYTNDAIQVHHTVGVVQLKIESSTSPVLVRTTGVGAVVGQRRLTIGWMSEEMVVFPDPSLCAALIYVTSRDDVPAVMRVLEAAGSNLSNICIAQGG
jgi:hypothetical protein